MTQRRAQVPWALSDARAAFFTTFGGFGALFVSWWGASGTGKTNHQVTWIVVGIVGIMVIGVGNFFWLLAGRRAVGQRQLVVLDDIGRAPLDAGRRAERVGPDLVAVAGSDRYHRAGCLLARDKPVTAVPADRRAELRACEMCRP